jgi:hypothetical protein
LSAGQQNTISNYFSDPSCVKILDFAGNPCGFKRDFIRIERLVQQY